MDDREKTVYLSLNGPFRPKCSRRSCFYFGHGFATEEELSSHISWHEMAFKCPHEGCYAWKAGCSTRAQLAAHLKRIHPVEDSEPKLFATRPEKRPVALLEQACRAGDIGYVRSLHLPSDAGFRIATQWAVQRGLYAAAQAGHIAICVNLAQKGADPYRNGAGVVNREAPVRLAIRAGDRELFLALRSAASDDQLSDFIKEENGVMECVLETLEFPDTKITAEVLAWNDRRDMPVRLIDLLLLRTYAFYANQQLFQPRAGWKLDTGLKALVTSELERNARAGLSPELSRERAWVAPDSRKDSLLHRFCEASSHWEHESVNTLKFILMNLAPKEIVRHDTHGNPALFTILTNTTGPASQVETEQHGSTLYHEHMAIRTFFEHDPEAAKQTRNSAGQGPLEFAFRRATSAMCSLVFELCNGDDGANAPISIPPGINKHQGLHLAWFGLDREELESFLDGFLETTRLSRRNTLDLLHTLQLPQTFSPPIFLANEYTHNISDLYDSLRAQNSRPRFKALAGKVLDRYHPQLEVPRPTRPRKSLFICLDASTQQYDFAKSLLIWRHLYLPDKKPEEVCPEFSELAARQDMDPEIIPLLTLRRYGGATFDSSDTQRRVVTLLEDNPDIRDCLKNSPEVLRADIEGLRRYAEANNYDDLAASLVRVMRPL